MTELKSISRNEIITSKINYDADNRILLLLQLAADHDRNGIVEPGEADTIAKWYDKKFDGIYDSAEQAAFIGCMVDFFEKTSNQLNPQYQSYSQFYSYNWHTIAEAIKQARDEGQIDIRDYTKSSTKPYEALVKQLDANKAKRFSYQSNPPPNVGGGASSL
jgi:hypothetical protein